MFLIGVIGASTLIATTLWGVWHPDDLGAAFVATLVVSGAVGAAGFVAASGCFVELSGEELRDVMWWRTVRRVRRDAIVEARVLAGPWRWFELELDDGRFVTLVGACPVQFPARLSPDAKRRDLATLEVLRA